MASPSPSPSCDLVLELSSCRNRSKTNGMKSEAIPIPESRTLISTAPSFRVRPTSIRPPRGVNFTAFVRRFQTICWRRCASQVITCDAQRLQQMVWNLLTNAVKFTPRGGRIDVGLTRNDGAVEISVRDSGIGIASDFIPFVFDRFRQEDSSSTRSHDGLGLGLAIVRHLSEL